ncbi:hypothetical protein RI129_003496 [Pyrocoelia pectoralis]|uniref:OPA3-like protein CG13603 n=1 Tax=Pyrocoelia pectoralis TaxID=417401 RepID=A0AAN7VRX3_9COLE
MGVALLKLGSILVNQISKPLTYLLVAEAKKSAFFRNYACLPCARLFHWGEVKTKMWLLRFGTAVQISVLNEAQATELGASLISEMIVFSIISGVAINEFVRMKHRDAKKKEEKRLLVLDLKNKLREISLQIQNQQEELEQLLKFYEDSLE